ncbi:hypothetical protein [Amorphus sp. 3PC139-8]|uniref:hypothetical protein n=1 Tax=Amorphus sp. 3PC139-8 TaxID=2735676 RepID=UPI00345DAF80
MTRIRDAQTIIGSLERGELAATLSEEISGTLAEMKDRSDQAPKEKVKGEITLKLKLSMEMGAVTITADVASKRPKAPRGSSFFWVTDSGELTTEHPQQHDMFKLRDATAD